jgi:hypothetical protein
MTNRHASRERLTVVVPMLFFGLIALAGTTMAEDGIQLTDAKWESGDKILVVKGRNAGRRATVTLENASTGAVLKTFQASREGKFEQKIYNLDPAPCRVRAGTEHRGSDERNVSDAPSNCDGGGSPSPVSGNFTILPANDLGMHCADLDYTVFSILPPLNVVHAQVIRTGTSSSDPELVDAASGVEVFYKATSNPNDPVGGDSINTTSSNAYGFKTNFWDLMSYSGPTNVDMRSFGFDAYAPLFFGLLLPEPVNVADVALPGCLSDPFNPATGCDFLQAQMPGPANESKQILRFDQELNFFDSLLGPLGLGAVVPEANLWSLEGLPVLPVDNQGRTNAYPLFTVEARLGGQVVAKTDVVTPVASEADCQNCHVNPDDCDTAAIGGVEIDPGLCIGAAMDRTSFVAVELADNPPGGTLREQLLNAAKLNILRLHDVKHSTDLEDQTPVQCSYCHYSPAVDLAQLGPTDTLDGTASDGLDGPPLSGTSQTSHISMSRAMHHHHGGLAADPSLPFDQQTNALFPTMPGPVGRSLMDTQDVLQETCYQCHPGKRTQCLRGAMAAGGVVCQDCHGGMLQVGDDFTANFPVDGSMDTSKRVPWAVEPGCQSCHVGDASNQPSNTSGFVWDNPLDPIRLLQAWRDGDTDAAPISSPDSRFAENRIINGDGQTVDLLYRLSKGHGGVMCEGCHGSTHAIFPNPNPNANDNVTATQLQGHSGTVIECSTCHANGLSDYRGLEGPHGMHVVGNTGFSDGGHEHVAENNQGACFACHGGDSRRNSQGTVLSRAAADRTLRNEGHTVTVSEGDPVGCALCHGGGD